MGPMIIQQTVVGRLDISSKSMGGDRNSYGQTPDNTIATFLGSGNVGIGTTSPDMNRLHVETSVTENQQLRIRNNKLDARAGIAILNSHGTHLHFNVW